MKRFAMAALVVAGLWVTPASAQTTTQTFYIAATTSTYVSSGSFSVASNGVSYTLTAFDLSLLGTKFDLSNVSISPTSPSVIFYGNYDTSGSALPGVVSFSTTPLNLAASQFVGGSFAITDAAGVRSTASLVAIRNAVTTAVPEAAQWAMMVVGVGMIGGALRRRRHATAVAFTRVIEAA